MSYIPPYIKELHQSLDSRLRPEDVLGIIVRGRPNSVPSEWRTMFRGAGSGPRPRYGYTLMSTDFERPVGAQRQLASAGRAFELGNIEDEFIDLFGYSVDGDNPHDVRFVVDSLAMSVGDNGRKLTKAQRKEAGIELSGRKYRRRWRAMRRLHHKANTLARQQNMREMELIGRSGFASTIPLERFAADPNAARFIAYWVAMKNRRREFSLVGRKNPMDEPSSYFLQACVDREHETDWEMIALVCPKHWHYQATQR